MSSQINSLIPNWALYRAKFPHDTETLDALQSRFATLESTGKLLSVAKELNVEFGMLILRNQEIDEGVREDLLRVFTGK